MRDYQIGVNLLHRWLVCLIFFFFFYINLRERNVYNHYTKYFFKHAGVALWHGIAQFSLPLLTYLAWITWFWLLSLTREVHKSNFWVLISFFYLSSGSYNFLQFLAQFVNVLCVCWWNMQVRLVIDPMEYVLIMYMMLPP